MKSKLPGGIPALVKSAKEAGVKFGIWIEPEMVNQDSALFREHPDWVLGETTRPRTLARNQYVLNFARDDVRDYAIACIDRLIDEYRLDYEPLYRRNGLAGRSRGETGGIAHPLYPQCICRMGAHEPEISPCAV